MEDGKLAADKSVIDGRIICGKGSQIVSVPGLSL